MGATCRPAALPLPLALPPPPAQTLLCCGHQPAAGYIQLVAMLVGPTCGAYCVLAVVAAAAAMGGSMVLAAAAGAHSTSLRIQAAAYPAFLLLSAAYWLPAARCMYTVAAAMLRCPSLAQLPATLLSPAVLPHVLLYLWGCERWHASAILEWWALRMSGFWMLMVLFRIHRHEHCWSSWPFDACRSLLLLLQPQVMQHGVNSPGTDPFSAAPCPVAVQHTAPPVLSACCEWLSGFLGQYQGGVPMANMLCIPSSCRHPFQAPTRCPARSSCICGACGSTLHWTCHLRQASAQLATSRSSLAATALRERLHGACRCGGTQFVGPGRLCLGPSPDSVWPLICAPLKPGDAYALHKIKLAERSRIINALVMMAVPFGACFGELPPSVSP